MKPDPATTFTPTRCHRCGRLVRQSSDACDLSTPELQPLCRPGESLICKPCLDADPAHKPITGTRKPQKKPIWL